MNNTALGFLGIYACGLFLALFRHPIFGLLTYLWAFYNHPPGRWWGAALPDLRWSLVAAVVTLIATLRLPPSTCPPWHANWGARYLIVYAAWMWIQSAWALDSSAHLEGCILITKYVVLFYVIYRIVSDETTLDVFSWGHVIGCFIFGWVAYGMTVSGRLESVGGPGLEDSNVLGMHQITGLIFAGFMFLGLRGKKRWIVIPTVPFILNSVILTASRSAFLGLLSAGLTTLFLSPRSRRFTICVAVGLGAILFFRLAPEQFWERMRTIKVTEETEMEASARSRFEINHYGWLMSKDYPFGAGYRGHRVLSRYYMPADLLTSSGLGQPSRSAHNTFMAILVEQGYPGAILYVILQGWTFISLFRLKPLDRLGLDTTLALYSAAVGTALITCFVCGQFINILTAEVQIWLIALLARLNYLCYKAVRKEK